MRDTIKIMKNEKDLKEVNINMKEDKTRKNNRIAAIEFEEKDTRCRRESR